MPTVARPLLSVTKSSGFTWITGRYACLAPNAVPVAREKNTACCRLLLVIAKWSQEARGVDKRKFCACCKLPAAAKAGLSPSFVPSARFCMARQFCHVTTGAAYSLSRTSRRPAQPITLPVTTPGGKGLPPEIHELCWWPTLLKHQIPAIGQRRRRRRRLDVFAEVPSACSVSFSGGVT